MWPKCHGPLYPSVYGIWEAWEVPSVIESFKSPRTGMDFQDSKDIVLDF